jgi:hypothetical protein
MPVMDVVRAAVALGALVLLVVCLLLVRLRPRVRRLERENGELCRAIANVQGWAERELRTIRGQLTAMHVNQTAEQIGERLAQKRALGAAAPMNDGPHQPVLEIVSSSADDLVADDETTHAISRSANHVDEPPMYAAHPEPSPRRMGTMRPRAPLAHPDLIGCEDIADETARPSLGPDELTPPRRRAAVLVRAFRATEEGTA